MKATAANLLVAVALLASGGCAGGAGTVKSYLSASRGNVFSEVPAGPTAAPGSALLSLQAAFKTHKQGAHYASDSHGTPQYKLLLNVDGQALLLTGRLRQETEPVRLQDPEGGDGIRYLFSSTLRLKPGKHRVAVAVPEDDIVVEKEITLAEGRVARLTIEPVYYLEPAVKRLASGGSFVQGLRGIRLLLNGEEI